MSNANADRAAKGGSARYAQNSGTGANEPKHAEKKEQREDWVHRQGGDQTRTGDTDGGSRDGGDRDEQGER